MIERFVILCLLIFQGLAFSIPGVSTKSFDYNESIPVYANELDSVKTQLNFEYYFLKYIRGNVTIDHKDENLGSILLGESTQATPYELKMHVNQDCKELGSVTLEKKDADNFKWMIERDYIMNLVIDNLPATSHRSDHEYTGVSVGFRGKNDDYIYNHLKFNIQCYIESSTNKSRIVGFSIVPSSMSGSYCKSKKDKTITLKSQAINTDEQIFFTYEVNFSNTTEKKFGSRWDHYKHQSGLDSANADIHWLSILNSFVINLILTTVIGYIMKRTIGNDIRNYNELKTDEDIQEDRGWKQLSRDVFRPPRYALLLSALIGTGVQVCSMFLLTLLFVCLGFMNQSYRGSLLKSIILFYTFMGMFAGYYSARVYKMFNGSQWIKCTLVTAMLYPGINFAVFYLINVALIFEESSSALHATTVLILIVLWFGISVPLVFLGSLIGYKKQAIQNPCKYNPIPKFVKSQPWYLNNNVLCLLGGLLPFGSVFIELVFIMMSVWKHSFYYLFAFLFAVILILVITCAEISIVITYLQLCNGNHYVWWRSFFNTGSISVYIFAYSIFYWWTELQMKRFSSVFLYFGYMLATSFTFFVFCGTIGFLASYLFVRTIYAQIRID